MLLLLPTGLIRERLHHILELPAVQHAPDVMDMLGAIQAATALTPTAASPGRRASAHANVRSSASGASPKAAAAGGGRGGVMKSSPPKPPPVAVAPAAQSPTSSYGYSDDFASPPGSTAASPAPLAAPPAAVSPGAAGVARVSAGGTRYGVRGSMIPEEMNASAALSSVPTPKGLGTTAEIPEALVAAGSMNAGAAAGSAPSWPQRHGLQLDTGGSWSGAAAQLRNYSLGLDSFSPGAGRGAGGGLDGAGHTSVTVTAAPLVGDSPTAGARRSDAGEGVVALRESISALNRLVQAKIRAVKTQRKAAEAAAGGSPKPAAAKPAAKPAAAPAARKPRPAYVLPDSAKPHPTHAAPPPAPPPKPQRPVYVIPEAAKPHASPAPAKPAPPPAPKPHKPVYVLPDSAKPVVAANAGQLPAPPPPKPQRPVYVIPESAKPHPSHAPAPSPPPPKPQRPVYVIPDSAKPQPKQHKPAEPPRAGAAAPSPGPSSGSEGDGGFGSRIPVAAASPHESLTASQNAKVQDLMERAASKIPGSHAAAPPAASPAKPAAPRPPKAPLTSTPPKPPAVRKPAAASPAPRAAAASPAKPAAPAARTPAKAAPPVAKPPSKVPSSSAADSARTAAATSALAAEPSGLGAFSAASAALPASELLSTPLAVDDLHYLDGYRYGPLSIAPWEVAWLAFLISCLNMHFCGLQ